ncbi:MAG: PAS domain-containing protein, partial [Sedimenticola sp.]
MNTSPCRILIVEDDSLFANNLKIHLLKNGYEVVGILSTAEDALEQFTTLAPHLVLMDIVLDGEMDGIQAAQLVRTRHSVPVLYLTVYSDEEFAARAMVTEPYAYILKPFNERELTLTIEMALFKHKVEQRLAESHAHLEEAQRVGQMGSWDWNITQNTLHWSKEIYRIFGIKEKEFDATYEAFLNTVHPDDRQTVINSVDATLKGGQPYSIDHRIVVPDGSIKIVHEQAEVQYDEEGCAIRMTGTVQDITESRQAEDELKLFATIFENIAEGVVITDPNNKVVMINDAYCSLTGYSREEIIGRNPNLMQSGHHDKTFYRAMWQSIKKLGRWQGEIWDKRKTGEIYPKWLSITALKNPQGDTTHHIGIFTDISELKNKEKHLQQLAYFDPLTGIANRSQFNTRLKQELAAAKRNEQSLALLYIDLNRFKQVNDYYGHGVGDQLLCQSAG